MNPLLAPYLAFALVWAAFAFFASERPNVETFFGALVFGALWPVLLFLVACSYVLGKVFPDDARNDGLGL